jgi:hypothetical protein
MQYDSEYPSTDAGLCWYDGVNIGTFPAPPGSVPQWGGLPNSSIADLEVRTIPGGYELWMSCLSRGIAVLTVPYNPTSVSETPAPSTFSLAQNYPNPFNPKTVIEFRVPSFGSVSLKVFDVLGREVATLVDDNLAPGEHEVRWDASGVASGVYLYQLRMGSYSETRKLVLLR